MTLYFETPDVAAAVEAQPYLSAAMLALYEYVWDLTQKVTRTYPLHDLFREAMDLTDRARWSWMYQPILTNVRSENVWPAILKAVTF